MQRMAFLPVAVQGAESRAVRGLEPVRAEQLLPAAPQPGRLPGPAHAAPAVPGSAVPQP